MTVEERCRLILDRALAALPDATVDAGARPVDRSTVQLVARVAGRQYRVNGRWAGEGWPADVSAVVASIPTPWPRSWIVVANELSPGAIDLLRERDANWVDAAGNVRLVIPPGLAVVREPASVRAEAKTPQAFRWSRSAEDIVEVLLHEPRVKLRAAELSQRTGWSVPQVSKVLQALDSEGWTVRHGPPGGRGITVRREVADPGELLDAWAAGVGSRPRRKRLGHVATRDLLRFAHMRLADALGREDRRWALTTWAGLELLAPFVTSVPALHVYVTAERFASSDIDRVFRRAQIREVAEGARVEFWEGGSRLITQPGRPLGLPVCSTPRLYTDLLAMGGRGTEAALHVRTTLLGY